MPPRVMYLHGLQGGGETSTRRQLLEQAVGAENVRAPNFQTRRYRLIYTISMAVFFAVLGLFSVAALINWSLFPAIVVTALLALIGIAAYIITGRGVTYYIVQTAVKKAEKEFSDFRPNVLVTSSFGAVVALNMRGTAKVSMVMLAPGQDNYCRYMRIPEFPTIAAYPYVLIVHGTCDNEVSLDDSVRLVDSIGYGSCKLELIDDYHSLSTLSAADFREFIEEAYTNGRNTIVQLQSQEKAKLIAPTKLDPTLFDLTPEGDEFPEQNSGESDTVDEEAAADNALDRMTGSVDPDEQAARERAAAAEAESEEEKNEASETRNVDDSGSGNVAINVEPDDKKI